MRHAQHKKDIKLCSTPYCRNKKEKHRSICSKCHKRTLKQNNPLSYTYSYIKNNARRRGHRWGLTMQDFLEFVSRTDYMAGKGREREKLSIDRIKPHLGYTPDNIQVLTVGQNATKGNQERYQCPF